VNETSLDFYIDLIFPAALWPRLTTETTTTLTEMSTSKLTGGKTRVEAGSNTSTVTLRVVRGDEMGLIKTVP
jgi:hypothetical protein